MVVSKEKKSIHLWGVAFKVVMKVAFRSSILMRKCIQTEGDRGVCMVAQ